MLKAKRANVILRINDNQVDYYVAKGYTVYAENGTVVKEPAGNEVIGLRKQNEEYAKKIALLEKELAELKAKEVEEPKVEVKESEEMVEEQPKPKKTKNK